MRRDIAWLIAIASAFMALSVVAADFESIELSLYSGWTNGDGIMVRGDGTLRLGGPDHPEGGDAGTCTVHVTQAELDSLSRLVGDIPDGAPWGQQWALPDQCTDEVETTLLVSTSRGRLDIRHSVDCRPPDVPAWVTNLFEALRQIQKKYAACGKQASTARDQFAQLFRNRWPPGSRLPSPKECHPCRATTLG